MAGVSDILKILDQIPLWKKLKEAPERIEELEKRIEEIEAQLENPGEPCPSCGANALRRSSQEPLPGNLGKLGAMRETWICASCGASDVRTTTPGLS